MGVLDGLVADKEDSSLEILEPIPIKAIQPLFENQKKIGPMDNIEAVNRVHWLLLVMRRSL